MCFCQLGAACAGVKLPLTLLHVTACIVQEDAAILRQVLDCLADTVPFSFRQCGPPSSARAPLLPRGCGQLGALVYRGGFAQEQGQFRWYRGPVMMMSVSRHERGQMAMDQMAGGGGGGGL